MAGLLVLSGQDCFLPGEMPKQAYEDAHFDDSLDMAIEDGYDTNQMPVDWLLLPQN